jgi:hypothetical protein
MAKSQEEALHFDFKSIKSKTEREEKRLEFSEK